MSPTIEAEVANKMDTLFAIRKIMGNKAYQPTVLVGDHTINAITGCITSAEVSRAIKDIVDRALSQGDDAFVLAEVLWGQDAGT